MKKDTEKKVMKKPQKLKSQKKSHGKKRPKRTFLGTDNQCINEEQSKFHFNDEEMSYSEIKFCP